jgi:hypothetical protein
LMGAPDKILREIRVAQVSTVFRQMPIALAVNAVNAAITAIVLQQLGPPILPLLWVSLVALVTAGRWALWRRYRRLPSKIERDPRWSVLATCGSLLAGLCWGWAGWFCSRAPLWSDRSSLFL